MFAHGRTLLCFLRHGKPLPRSTMLSAILQQKCFTGLMRHATERMVASGLSPLSIEDQRWLTAEMEHHEARCEEIGASAAGS
jgi:hypothetical protein